MVVVKKVALALLNARNDWYSCYRPARHPMMDLNEFQAQAALAVLKPGDNLEGGLEVRRSSDASAQAMREACVELAVFESQHFAIDEPGRTILRNFATALREMKVPK